MLAYSTVPAALAIRGHKSAHSLATGPLIAEPFISPFTFTITAALSVPHSTTGQVYHPVAATRTPAADTGPQPPERAAPDWSARLRTLKVDEASAVHPPPRLALAHDNSRHHCAHTERRADQQAEKVPQVASRRPPTRV